MATGPDGASGNGGATDSGSGNASRASERARARLRVSQRPAPPSGPRPATKRPFALGRFVARMFSVFLAFVGLLPLVIGVAIRTPWVKRTIAAKILALAAAQGVVADFGVEPELIPLGVTLTDVRVASNDGGADAVRAERIRVRPRFFALLAGKVVLADVELVAPRVRAVISGRRIVNLGIEIPESKKSTDDGPIHVPLETLSISDGTFEVAVDDGATTGAIGLDLAGKLSEVDADVVITDGRAGATFDVALRVGSGTVTRRHGAREAPIADDDALCTLDARVRVAPGLLADGTPTAFPRIDVRRFVFAGVFDDERKSGTFPSCTVAADDPHTVRLELGHVAVEPPPDGEKIPRAEGHITAKIPLLPVQRIPGAPDVAGDISIDADVRVGDRSAPGARKNQLPDVDGRLTAKNIRVDKFSFAHEVESRFTVRDDVITSPETTVTIAGGVATLTNVRVAPLAEGIPLETDLHATGVHFNELMKDLGVHPNAHVGWELDDIRATHFAGTITPLKIEGKLEASTRNFGVYNRPFKDPTKEKYVGFQRAELSGKVAVDGKEDALVFKEMTAIVGRSRLDQGRVAIGFHGALVVDVPKGDVQIEDIAPIAGIPAKGLAHVKVHVGERLDDPWVRGEARIDGLDFADIPFGDITQAKVAFHETTVDLEGVEAKKGKSLYAMPSARLEFGTTANFAMDGEYSSKAFDLRDLLGLFHMEDDPRFLDVQASVEARGRIRVVLGGPEDHCGSGIVRVAGDAVARRLDLFGETFADAHADFDYDWQDRAASSEGASLTVRSFALHKVHDAGKSPLGAVVGAMTMRPGGVLAGTLAIDGFPLSRLDKFPEVAAAIDGTAGGTLSLDGTLDAYRVRGDVELSTLYVKGSPFPPSRLHFRMNQTPSPKPPLGRSRCGNPIRPPFDKNEYLTHDTPQGLYVLDGELFGGKVLLDGLTMTRQQNAHFGGKVHFASVDVAPLLALGKPADDPARVAPPLEGTFSGDLLIESAEQNDFTRAKVSFQPTEVALHTLGERIDVYARQGPIRVADGSLFVPEIRAVLSPAAKPTVRGVDALHPPGAIVLSGKIDDIFDAPDLNVKLAIEPIDLSGLVGLSPQLNRASGSLEGAFTLKGDPNEPDVDGALRLRGGQFAAASLPSPVTDLEVDVAANTSEIRIEQGSARFAGGDLSLSGVIPLRGATFGQADLHVGAKALKFAPLEGLRTGVDADLELTADLVGDDRSRLPRLTGTISLSGLEYTRAIAIGESLTRIGAAKRTVVETYDPALDSLALDVTVVSRTPMRIRNNFAEMQLAIAEGGLQVTGTNQRLGVRGRVDALNGGKLRILQNEFEIRTAQIRFDDPTKIAPYIDATAVTEYRRSSLSSAAVAPGRQGGQWRIGLHAYGPSDELAIDMTSEPALSKEDITLLLTVGVTRAELDANSGLVFAYEAAGEASGATRAVKKVIPIDDFRFGSWYSPRTGRPVPNVTVGQRISEDVTLSGTTGLAEDRLLRAAVDARLGPHTSVQGSWDNLSTIVASGIGNVGGGFRWRLEFE